MRKLFVRFFLGFVAVLCIVFGILFLSFFMTGRKQQRAWNKDIYANYIDKLSENLTKNVPEEGWNVDNLDDVLLCSADDRVSGLLLKDTEGNIVVQFGQTRTGTPLEENDRRRNKQSMLLLPQDEEFHTVRAKTDTYVVAITEIKQSFVHTYATVTYRDKAKSADIELPKGLRAGDIVGSISLMMNGEDVAKVDVLAYTPLAYKPFAHFLLGFYGPLLWSIPFAFIVALIMAYSISRKNQKYTVSVQTALSSLAKGEYAISLPKTKIDEQVCINDSINDLARQLSQHEKSRKEWLLSISHDLNTPVTSMKLLLDGMTDGVFPMNEENIRKIKDENDTLEGRIASISLYSKLSSPDMKATMETMDAGGLSDGALSSFPETDRKRITVRKEVSSLTGDAKLLSIAANELLKNALKASPGQISWTIGNNSMIFTNDGILPEHVDFFEPWTKGDQSRGTNGSGMGLPIVNQVMLLHGGTAEIKGQEGKVTVTLSW